MLVLLKTALNPSFSGVRVPSVNVASPCGSWPQNPEERYHQQGPKEVCCAFGPCNQANVSTWDEPPSHENAALKPKGRKQAEHSFGSTITEFLSKLRRWVSLGHTNHRISLHWITVRFSYGAGAETLFSWQAPQENNRKFCLPAEKPKSAVYTQKTKKNRCLGILCWDPNLSGGYQNCSLGIHRWEIFSMSFWEKLGIFLESLGGAVSAPTLYKNPAVRNSLSALIFFNIFVLNEGFGSALFVLRAQGGGQRERERESARVLQCKWAPVPFSKAVGGWGCETLLNIYSRTVPQPLPPSNSRLLRK